MTTPWIRVTPRPENPALEYCEQCQAPMVERWEEARRRCGSCSLEADLFDPRERRQRISQPA